MIRINLLPVRAKKKRNTSLYQLMSMSAAVLVALFVAASVHAYFTSVVADQEKKIAEADEEIKRLQKIIGEVNELDKQKQRLLAQLAVIDKLEKGKRGPVHVLDDLSTNIPKRVWINRFTENGGSLSMTGAALENADISEFMRSLQKSPYFGDVQLKFTQSDVRDGVAIYTFEVTCQVNYQATAT
jgi:type IV pilus assembly protein PilN